MDNSWDNLYISFLLLIIALPFTCGEKKVLARHQKVSGYYEIDCVSNLLLLFISLLTAPIVKNSHF